MMMRWAILLLAVCGMICPSCNHNSPGRSGFDLGESDHADWPFWPTAVRIHPSSRLATDATGEPIIELRLQFNDAWNDLAKAVGEAHIELFGSINDPPLRTWLVDLTETDYNAERFDDVTWTYLLNLRLQGLDPPAENHIQIQFDSVNGAKLKDLAQLRIAAPG
jgi:hypothetical protein